MKALPLLILGVVALALSPVVNAAVPAKPVPKAKPARVAKPAPASKPATLPVGFDRPNKYTHLPLGPGKQAKDVRLGTSCFYYSRFMIKQVDEGEVGSAQLSILHETTPPKPLPCLRKNLPGEIVVPAKQWSGYFRGVKGDFVLFDAADGSNGALGFAVFTVSTATKLFEDSAASALQQVALDGGTLKLTYTRSFPGSCSMQIDGEPCWGIIEHEAGITKPATMPDCAAGYQQGRLELAKGRCRAKPHAEADCLDTELKGVDGQHFDQSPSVIQYPVEADIDPVAQLIIPQPGPIACRAAD